MTDQPGDNRALVDELARMGLSPEGAPPEPAEAVATPVHRVDPVRSSESAPRTSYDAVPDPTTALGYDAVPAPTPAPAYDTPAALPEPAHEPATPTPSAWTRPSAESLTADTVLRPRRNRPSRGWRRTVYTMSGGLVNPGPSAAELSERELTGRARTPIRGCYRVAVISLKGGVGKTTTTAALGSMFASLRGDRVIAVDANPDRGTLGEKVPRETSATVRDVVHARESLTRYADIRSLTSQAPSRLEVLASDADPSVSQAFGEADYRTVVELLELYYSLILTDCGTGLLHSALQGALAVADSLVVVSSPSLDGARSASATLDWLDAHGRHELVARSVAVISSVRPDTSDVDVDRLEEHFAARCRAVQRIPYDAHLAAGATIDLGELRRPTREAYRELAAKVGDGFTDARR